MSDDPPASGYRWMTYGEIAEARGIDDASARRLVARKTWAKQQGNDKAIRVAVPDGEDRPRDDAPRPDAPLIADVVADARQARAGEAEALAALAAERIAHATTAGELAGVAGDLAGVRETLALALAQVDMLQTELIVERGANRGRLDGVAGALRMLRMFPTRRG